LRQWFQRSVEEVDRERRLTSGPRFGQIVAPPRDDLQELRLRQAEFERSRRAIADENSWMALFALGPAAAVSGLEAGAALAARLAPQVITRAPLVLTEKLPYLRVGDNWATRAGRRAHNDFKARVQAKPAWDAETSMRGKTATVRPDAMAPARDRLDPTRRRFIELKPNTPSGRRAGERSVRKYEEETGNRTRVIYCNPKDFM
jgi:hypothetical protein